MDLTAVFWVVVLVVCGYILIASVSRQVGFYHRLFRRKFFIRSFGIEPLQRTPEKVEVVERRLTEFFNSWRSTLAQLRQMRADSDFGKQFILTLKHSIRCRELAQQALFSAASYEYYCALPFFDQFRQLLSWQKKAMRG